MAHIFRYKLSILIHGLESDRPVVNQMIMDLQVQLNRLSKFKEVDEVEATFYLDDKKDAQKRKKWCLARTTGTHYIELVAPFKIKNNYLEKLWSWLEKHEADEKKLAEKKIFKRKPYQVNIHNPAYLEEIVEFDDGIEDAEVTDVTDQE